MANCTCPQECDEALHSISETPAIDLFYTPYVTVTKLLVLTVLLSIKIIGHLSISAIIDPNKGGIFANIIWFVCQLIISWINNLFVYISLFQFILIQSAICYLLTIIPSSIKRSKNDKPLNLSPFIMGILELFWLFACNDISCIACYIFIFEGCFVQRIKTEYLDFKWTDKHLWTFALAKIIFISWLYISLNWILSICEMLYFVVPIISLKYKPKMKLTFDQWFLMDGCSHISIFSAAYFFSFNTAPNLTLTSTVC